MSTSHSNTYAVKKKKIIVSLEIQVALPKESQLRQSRATQPYLMTSLAHAVSLCDHTTGCEVYYITTGGYGILYEK